MNKNFNINASKIRGYKNTFYAVSLIMIFAMSIAMAFAPSATAQVGIPQPRATTGYISAAPLLIGVGQELTVNLWVCPLPQDYATAPYNSGFSGVSVTFTRPDGTKDTFMPTDGSGIYPAGVVDPLGTSFFLYTPNMVGNWSVTMSMPAQNFTDATGTVQWKSCTSAPAYFTVTTEAQNAGLLNGWPYSPLPNSNVYWTYPISPNNREWSAISGDWYTGIVNSGGSCQLYGSAPSTGHIVWDVPFAIGGLVGGSFGSISYQPTTIYGYTTYYAGTASGIIVDGKEFLENAENSAFTCYDLATGKALWTASGYITSAIELLGNPIFQAVYNGLTTGVVLEASYGSTPTAYLFGNSGTIWNYYDIINGALVRSITNVTSSSVKFVNGTPIAFGYVLMNFNATTEMYARNYLYEWNITKVVNNDWYTGLVWTHTVNNPATRQLGPGDGAGRPTFVVSADLSTLVYGAGAGGVIAEGFNANTGASIWNITLGYCSLSTTMLFGTNDFLTYDCTYNTYYCYSDLTGALLWSTPDVGPYPWNTKTSGTIVNDNNNLYIAQPEGSIVALSLATGKQLWLSTPFPSTEYATNAVPYWQGITVEAGGLLYAAAEYSIYYELNPIPRDAMLICINATTGQTVFTLNSGLYPAAAADGYLWCFSEYNANYYCIGKGQTSTAVTVPNNALEGVRVQIQGNVLDQSPAQQGTPAVSDASMSEQMDFLHMQNATLLNNPPQEQGVPVTLTAVDPNNNTVTIGTTRTNSEGNYYFNWTPSMTGTYVITASFAGSGSYWPSTAQTGTVVNAAPTATSSTSVATTSSGVSDTALYTGIAAVIVVIIIVGIAIILMQQRKRP